MYLNAVLSYHNSHQLSPMYSDDVHIQTKDVARYVQVPVTHTPRTQSLSEERCLFQFIRIEDTQHAD